MKAPAFWYKPPCFFSLLLWPLSWLYGRTIKIWSFFQKPYFCEIPIISIGNIVCGGAGKTPTAIAIGNLLQQQGFQVHFVTRGYGGKEKGPLRVDSTFHSADRIGDEALLLAYHSPTWVAKNRVEGVNKALENGAQIIILDDGHQTLSLHKDISFMVIDSVQKFGNEYVLPAGPLREELKEGLKRADGFITIGGELHPDGIIPAKAGISGPPYFNATIIPQPLSLPSKRVVAFCGLGFPQKFYNSLKNCGFDLVMTESFPDHYLYKRKDLIRLQKLSQQLQGVLVTTRKDWVRIPSSCRKHIYVLDINIQFEHPEKICNFIFQKIYPLKESA